MLLISFGVHVHVHCNLQWVKLVPCIIRLAETQQVVEEGLELFDTSADGILDIDVPDDSLVDDLNSTENQSFMSQPSTEREVSVTFSTPGGGEPKKVEESSPKPDESRTEEGDASTLVDEEEDDAENEPEVRKCAL